jgi:hypothetical protein
LRRATARGVDAKYYSDLGPRGLSDEEWTSLVAARGWVAVTRDRRIRYRAAEKAAVKESRLALFVIATRTNVSQALIVETIAMASRRMADFLNRHEPPFIAAIDKVGAIRLLERL